MGKYTSDLVEIGIGKESSRGTAVAPTYGVKWTDLSLADAVDKARDESRSGILEDSRDSYVVGTMMEGDITGPVRDKAIGLFLLSCLGSASSSVVETTAYEHTFNVLETNQHPTLTVHKKDPNSTSDHANALVTSIEVSSALGDLVQFTASIRAKSRASQSRTVSYATENIFLPQHGSFKLASSQSGLAAASAISIRSAKLNISSDADYDRALGSVAPTDIFNRKMSGSLEVEIVLSADTYITALIAGTSYAAQLDFTNTDVTIGGSTNPRLRFDLYRVKLIEASPKYSKGDLTMQTLKFDVHYSESDSKMVVAYLRNLATSY